MTIQKMRRSLSGKKRRTLPTSGPRRARRTWIAATVAASVALVGVGAGAPAAMADDRVEWAEEIAVPQGWRTLAPLADEMVPAYQCPASHPYLTNDDYAPVGTTLLRGVEIQQEGTPWPIGVSITYPTATEYPLADLDLGLFTGISDAPLASSAMNWSFWASQRYQVILHCTNGPHLASNDATWIVKPPRT